MKVKEVTNPEEQLGLLRVIIDNTWSAIKQQADAYARQKSEQPVAKPKKGTANPKPPPYAAKPPPSPKPRPPYSQKPQPIMKSTIGKAVHQQPQISNGKPRLFPNNTSNQTGSSLSNLEKDEFLNLPRGALPKPLE